MAKTIHPKAQTDVAVPKRPRPNIKNRLPTRRDVRDLTSEELTGGEFRCFPEDPADSFKRNYRQPLRPRNKPKTIRGLGFGITRPWIEDNGGSVDPLAFLNNLKHASVVLTKGERNKEIFSKHITQFIDFGLWEDMLAAYDNGTNSGDYEAFLAADVPGRALGNAEKNMNYELAPGQEFSLIIEPRNTDDIPAEADWNTIPQLLCILQIEHSPNKR